MRTINVLTSALHLVIVMLIFGLGAFLVTIYFHPKILLYFINMFINNPGVILKTGFFTLLLSLILFTCFYFIYKAQYMKFSMKRNKCCVDTQLIRNYLEKYFANIYPQSKHKFHIYVSNKDKLEIITTVDSLENQKEFLLNIEEKIGKLLSDHLDYHKEFIFTLKSKK